MPGCVVVVRKARWARGLWTASEIAEVFRVSTSTVRSWCKKGLPHRRAGRRLLLDLNDVLTWTKDPHP